METRIALDMWTQILTRGGGLRPTEAVLVELSEYSGMAVEEVRSLAATSASVTAQKWTETERSTPEGLREFYNSVSNWVFGTLSYHARQAEGENEPLPVKVATAIADRAPGDTLDFGCGVATASLLFARMGWSVAAADISTPLLEFARWRLERHGVKARVIDLNSETLDTEAYDLITAFNTMAHVPRVSETLSLLRTALRPSGLLVFDIDSRKRGTGDEWHLYETDGPILRVTRKAGFVRRPDIAGALYAFERVKMSFVERAWWGLFDALYYSAMSDRIKHLARRVRRRLIGR